MRTCQQCEKQFSGELRFTITEIRSPRVNMQTAAQIFCSDRCREKWWVSPTEEDLVVFEDASPSEKTLDPAILHKDDVGIALFRMDGTGKDPVPKEKSGHAFEHAGAVNPWWKTPTALEKETLSMQAVPCSREGGFHFLEEPPEHWILVKPATFPARVVEFFLMLWHWMLHLIGLHSG